MANLANLTNLELTLPTLPTLSCIFFIGSILDLLHESLFLPCVIPSECRVRRLEVMTKTGTLLARQGELHRTALIEPLTINELQKAMKNLSRACINPRTTSRAALVWCCILCYASPVANSLRLRFTPGLPLQLYVRFFDVFCDINPLENTKMHKNGTFICVCHFFCVTSVLPIYKI